MLPLAQLAQGVLLIDLAGQVESPQSLHRHNALLAQARLCQCDGVPLHRMTGGVPVGHLGAAHCAAIRLRMVAPVFNVSILRLALWAHGERTHRGEGAVIGDISDDCKPRAAVGTVEEGIPVAPVTGISQLPQAILTDAHVGADQGVVLAALLAGSNGKSRIVLQRPA